MKSTALIDASHSARVGSLRYQLGSMGDNGYSFIFFEGPGENSRGQGVLGQSMRLYLIHSLMIRLVSPLRSYES